MRERVRIRDIRPSQTNPREEFGDIAALAETIRATGGEPVNPPVLVRDGNVYRIVDGERRYRALCETYGKGSDREVAALVFDGWGEADEAVAMMATDDKRSLSERERARGVQQMLTLGVDEERAARASRATGAQVSAARKVARLVPEGVQPTLDQMLAASELPEEDAERVLAASNWQWEVADIRERDRRARRREQIRRALDESESTPIPFTPLHRQRGGALHIPRLELRGAEIAQSRVDPDPVAGALYVLEDLERRPLARLEGPRAHAPRLDGAHGRPRRGVVPRRGYRPHRGLDAGLAHRLARQQRDVLRAVIRVVDATLPRVPAGYRHPEGVVGEPRRHPVRHRPADDPAGPYARHDRQVEPPLARARVGDVGEPRAVRAVRAEFCV